MAPEGEARGSARPRILVVERDAVVRELVAYFLGEAGFSVDFSADGADALERARRSAPDVLVTEVLVPKLDGLALCRSLKGDPATRDVIVIVFSILAAGERAREAGAEAFLLKPLAERVLLHTIRELLARRARIQPEVGP